jgi:Trp operon repressor
VVHAFERAVSDDHAILIVATERDPGAERVRLATQQAVAALAQRHQQARKNYAGTASITRGSGTRRVVLARIATNKRLRDALALQALLH